MAPPFTAPILLLLGLFTAVAAAPQNEGCNCRDAWEVVERQEKEIARLHDELRTLRGNVDPAGRRLNCGGHWVVYSDAELALLQGCRAVGTLQVSGVVTSLAALSSLETADTITISHLFLESLGGLEKLTHVRSLRLLSLLRLRSFAALQSLEAVEELFELENSLVTSLHGLENLTRVERLDIGENQALQSLAGLDNLAHAATVLIRSNWGLQSLAGLGSLVRVEDLLEITSNYHLLSLAGLERLESAARIRISENHELLSVTGLEGLVETGALSLHNNWKLESVAGLRSLARVYAGGIELYLSPRLHSLKGFGALRAVTQLHVEYCNLVYMGGPFATAAWVNALNFDEYSWPKCITPQERMALLRVTVYKNGSVVPQARWESVSLCGTYFGTHSCTKGQRCNFSLVGHTGGGIFVSGRSTGCGTCSEKRPQGNVTEDGTVDLGYALWDEEPGLHSICRCGDGIGPVAQLLLRGPWQGTVKVCSRGRNCSFRVEGEALERTDRVVLMSNCSSGNPRSGFAASWTAENASLLHNPATWYAAPPDVYQVCWRAPCTSAPDGPTCPAPEDSYFHVGEVELVGAYTHNYSAVLGDEISFSVPNIGFGVSDGDRMRLRRACGEADDDKTEALTAVSSDMVFDFGKLTPDRLQAGRFRLCWCQERDDTVCNAGWHFRADSGAVEILCPAGEELVDSGRCQVCPAGKQKAEPGFSPCLESADADAAGCSFDPTMLGVLALFCLLVGAFCAMLVHSLGRRLLVVDVSLVQDQTIVTTLRPHGFANFGRPSFPVTLHGTGHPGLDSSIPPLRARVKDAVRLELLTVEGEFLNRRRLDTSMGTLTVAFPHDLLHQNWLLVPAAVGLALLFLTVVAALCSLVLWAGLATEALTGASAAALACTAVSVTLRWWPRITPLERRLSDFQLRLAQQPNAGMPCEKGPNRAIAIGKLHELLQFFSDFIRDRSAYYLATNILQPLTKAKDLSYAELAGAEQVDWFVSHFWGSPFAHFCMSLRRHAETVCGQRDWTTLRYWICFCSDNQHRLAHEIGRNWSESSFCLALRSGHCRGTCMVLDDKALPLTRIWCIFEVLQTLLFANSQPSFQGLHLCTTGGVLNAGGGSPEAVTALAVKVAEMDPETAEATREDDAERIRAQVLNDIGSYAALNRHVCVEVRRMLVGAQQSANQHFSGAFARLDWAIQQNPERRHL